MGISAEIAPFGDSKLENFFSWGWGWRRKFPQKRFGDGDNISSSAPRKLLK
jgi:hypothetical protein